jgi:basic membrane protein A and related proteins
MEPTIDAAIRAVKAGSFKAEDYGHFSMMKHKGSELSPLGTFAAKVPKATQELVAKRQKEILAGTFTVKVDDNQPKGTAK